MSGCQSPYIMGNVAFNQYAHPTAVNNGPMCSCPCHAPVWMGLGVPPCWCACNNQILKIVTDNSMGLLKDRLDQIEKRLDPLEKWKKTAKILCDQAKRPHKCPICEGLGKATAFHGGCCLPCDGKGIIWG